MPQPSPFSSDLFQFFRALDAHNEKEWFEANRERYEESVLEPSKVFVMAFRPHLKRISPEFRAEPRVRGGSLFRIHTNRTGGSTRTDRRTRRTRGSSSGTGAGRTSIRRGSTSTWSPRAGRRAGRAARSSDSGSGSRTGTR